MHHIHHTCISIFYIECPKIKILFGVGVKGEKNNNYAKVFFNLVSMSLLIKTVIIINTENDL